MPERRRKEEGSGGHAEKRQREFEARRGLSGEEEEGLDLEPEDEKDDGDVPESREEEPDDDEDA